MRSRILLFEFELLLNYANISCLLLLLPFLLLAQSCCHSNCKIGTRRDKGMNLSMHSANVHLVHIMTKSCLLLLFFSYSFFSFKCLHTAWISFSYLKVYAKYELLFLFYPFFLSFGDKRLADMATTN